MFALTSFVFLSSRQLLFPQRMRILHLSTATLGTTFQTRLAIKIAPIFPQYLAKLAPTTHGPVHPPRRIGYDRLPISWARPHGAEYWGIIGVFSTGWGRPARFLLVSASERPGETPGNQTVASAVAAPAPTSWTPSASGRATNASDMLELILRKQPFSRGADSDNQRLKIMHFSVRPTEILRRFPCHGSRDEPNRLQGTHLSVSAGARVPPLRRLLTTTC
ncbi:hypothetical protein DFH09DRAFT_1089278 [Mycena vulgaris]|nr:hypothetical protein DFH09DRAFT_1089278 [Mycena vulgaris]